jgi:hypothetical protein
MEGPSKGHELFEQWLIATYGGSTRRPGRPAYAGLKAARKLIAQEVRKISGTLRPPKSPIILYHWIASAQDSSRVVPRRHIRTAIETITGGVVPRSSWEEPAEASPAPDEMDTSERLLAAGGSR